jgi:hypothetical protein
MYAHYNVVDFKTSKEIIGGGLVIFSTNKTYRHDIIEILLKVALNTITLSPTLY